MWIGAGGGDVRQTAGGYVERLVRDPWNPWGFLVDHVGGCDCPAHSIGGDGNDTVRSNVGDDISPTFYCEIVSKLNSASQNQM